MKKWERDINLKIDAKQTLLTPVGCLRKPKPKTNLEFENEICLCPFCLTQAPAHKFAVSTGKGFHKSLGKCLFCGHAARWDTLKRKWTTRQFALFCFEYAKSGFWSKVNFAKFNEGLKRLGVQYSFWDRYKELKGETVNTYEKTD